MVDEPRTGAGRAGGVRRNALSADQTRELFNYDPLSGKLTWRATGEDAGSLWRGCRVRVYFEGKKYQAHNLIWVWMKGALPVGEVDHKNRIGSDNRWDNLREATRGQNQANTGLYRNNKARVRGVHFVKSLRRWRAMVCSGGKNRHLGYFSDKEQAQQAWISAASQAHGEFVAHV